METVQMLHSLPSVICTLEHLHRKLTVRRCAAALTSRREGNHMLQIGYLPHMPYPWSSTTYHYPAAPAVSDRISQKDRTCLRQ